jgi:hypothetical protein
MLTQKQGIYKKLLTAGVIYNLIMGTSVAEDFIAPKAEYVKPKKKKTALNIMKKMKIDSRVVNESLFVFGPPYSQPFFFG